MLFVAYNSHFVDKINGQSDIKYEVGLYTEMEGVSV